VIISVRGGETMLQLLTNLLRDEEGQGMVEYGLIIALIAIAVIAALTAMQGSLSDVFNSISTSLSGS